MKFPIRPWPDVIALRPNTDASTSKYVPFVFVDKESNQLLEITTTGTICYPPLLSKYGNYLPMVDNETSTAIKKVPYSQYNPTAANTIIQSKAILVLDELDLNEQENDSRKLFIQTLNELIKSQAGNRKTYCFSSKFKFQNEITGNEQQLVALAHVLYDSSRVEKQVIEVDDKKYVHVPDLLPQGTVTKDGELRAVDLDYFKKGQLVNVTFTVLPFASASSIGANAHALNIHLTNELFSPPKKFTRKRVRAMSPETHPHQEEEDALQPSPPRTPSTRRMKTESSYA